MNDDNERKANQLDRIEIRLDSIDVTLVKNTISLDEHIKRTNLLEEELKPVKAHVNLMNAMAKIVAAGGTILLGLKQLGLF